MAPKRIAAGQKNLKALKEFVAALMKEDTLEASSALGKLKLKDNDFGRGYRKALAGMKSVVSDQEVDSLTYKCIKGHLSKEEKKELRKEFSGKRNMAFAAKDEQGFFAAWKDVLKLIDTTKKPPKSK